jgi:hypothetical protein
VSRGSRLETLSNIRGLAQRATGSGGAVLGAILWVTTLAPAPRWLSLLQEVPSGPALLRHSSADETGLLRLQDGESRQVTS